MKATVAHNSIGQLGVSYLHHPHHPVHSITLSYLLSIFLLFVYLPAPVSFSLTSLHSQFPNFLLLIMFLYSSLTNVIESLSSISYLRCYHSIITDPILSQYFWVFHVLLSFLSLAHSHIPQSFLASHDSI